jgi:hypothetical protein
MFKNLISTATILLLCLTLQAQEMPLLEKPHEISRASRKGYLGQVIPNPAAKTFDMVFVLKGSGKTKLKTEVYTFDQELNLVNTQREEEELEKVKVKYKWLTYRGDELKFTMTSISTSYKGELVLRRKEVSQYWNWWYGYYSNRVKVLEKIKAEDEAGNKYAFIGGLYENYVSGKTLAYAPMKEDKAKMGYANYNILSIDGALKFEKIDEISFKGLFRPVYSKPVTNSDNTTTSNEDAPRDWVTIFAAANAKGNTSKTTDYVYVRVSPEGKVKEKVEFSSPTNGWRILDIVEKNNKITIVGSGIEKKVDSKYFHDIIPMGNVSLTSMTEAESQASVDTKGTGAASILGGGGAVAGLNMIKKFSSAETAVLTQEKLEESLNELTYDHFIVGQITNGVFKMCSYADIAAFEKVQQKPADQKKFLPFDGKKFVIDNISVEDDGSINITGQDMDYKKGNKIFGEAYLFKYDTEGKLVANYGVEIEQKGKTRTFFNGKGPKTDEYPTSNKLYQSADKGASYWIMMKIKDFRVESSSDYEANYLAGTSTITTTTSHTPLRAIQYGAVNNKTLAISNVKDLGEDEKKPYFLFNKHNALRMGNFTIFLSETKKGDKILLSRFDMSK